MSNEYEYYVPNPDNKENNENNAPNGSHNGGMPPKKPYKMPKVISVICLGLVFGVVGGTAFQATNVVADRILGKNEKTVATSGTSAGKNEVGSAKLNQNTSTVTSDVSAIAKNAMPSVVSITNMSVQQVQNFFGGIQQQETKSSGSGIIVGQNDTELLVVTNNHVVEGSETLTVTFIDNKSVEAKIKGTDPDKDLAVVAVPIDKIESDTMKEIATATMGDSANLQVGEPVIAIGNALGYGQSVTTGIVSAKDRTLAGTTNEDGTEDSSSVKYIQTDAAINPGNSGGALLNANGEVVGINTAKATGNTVEGMGYAIPVSDVSDIIENLMNRVTREKVAEEQQGQLGIKGVDVSTESSQMYNMPEGVYISEVISGSGAEKAGLTKGSIITKFDGTSIDSMAALKDRLQYYKVGETISVTVQVPGAAGEYKEQTVDLTLSKNS